MDSDSVDGRTLVEFDPVVEKDGRTLVEFDPVEQRTLVEFDERTLVEFEQRTLVEFVETSGRGSVVVTWSSSTRRFA